MSIDARMVQLTQHLTDTQTNTTQGASPLIEGRILLERSAFIGHSFSESDHELANFFKSFLSEMGLRCTSGEQAETSQVHEKVKRRILEADIFVGILTRRDKIESRDEWRTADWLVEELTFAAANKKQLIVLKESKIGSVGGLQGDREYVEFDRDCLHKCVLKLTQVLWSMNRGRIKLATNQPPELSIDLLESAVAMSPNEPALRLQLAQQKVARGQLDSALRHIDDVLSTFPEYAPALREKAKAFRALGRKEDGEQILRQLLVANPADGSAHHLLGHVLEDKNLIADAESEYETASNCEPGDPRNYFCHGKLVYRTAGNDPERLAKAKYLFDVAAEVGGTKTANEVKSHLLGIARRMPEPSTGTA